MQFSKVISLVALLTAPFVPVVAGKLTTEDALAVLDVREAIEFEIRDLEARACPYSNCDECLLKHAPCRAFENNGDCLSCALQWYFNSISMEWGVD